MGIKYRNVIITFELYYTDYFNFGQIFKTITDKAKSSNNNNNNNKGSKSKGNSNNGSSGGNSSGSNNSRKGSSSNSFSGGNSNKPTLNKDEITKLFNESRYFLYKKRGYTKYNYLKKEKYNKD